MKKYTQKDLDEIWEQAIEILEKKHITDDIRSNKIYASSFLYMDEKRLNIIFTSISITILMERNYKEYMKCIKEVLSGLTGIKNIKINFQFPRTIEPGEKYKFEMLEERLDKIEELLIK